MSKTINTVFLKESIGASENLLRKLKERITFLDILSRKLDERKIEINFISELGFDPEGDFLKGKRAVQRSKKALGKVENGKAKDPAKLEDISYEAMINLHYRVRYCLNEIDTICYIFEDKYGKEAAAALEEAEFEFIVNDEPELSDAAVVYAP